MTRPRVLLALTVFNGRDVVPAALASVARLSQEIADVDVLVLDDCSPEPGFADDLAGWCALYGHRLYRSPRNLGIPRNVNLGLLAALDGGYDHVIISNSDVVYSANAVDQLVRVAESDPRIGSVTAWSTNVSMYSIPNRAPDLHLSHQSMTDEVGDTLADLFDSQAIDIPAGISFAMLIPVPVLRSVGIMDPVFGRGYCEETDWSRRCLAAGYRVTLAPGAFVYHSGSGSTLGAGLLAPGQSTVPANERIIDLRYPEFRDEVAAFYGNGTLQELWHRATTALIANSVRRHGYEVAVGLRPPTLSPSGAELDPVQVDVVIDGDQARCIVDATGFTEAIDGHALTVASEIRARFGDPISVDLFDVGPWADRCADAIASDQAIIRHRNYPARV